MANNELQTDDLIKGSDFPLPPKPRKLEPVRSILFRYKGERTVSAICELAVISEANWYKLLNGQSEPRQDTMLRIAFVLHMTAEDTQTLLKGAHCPTLTATRARDILIVNGLHKGCSLGDMNDELIDKGEEPLL